jgi:uncharacterized protein (TIGR02265 family)
VRVAAQESGLAPGAATSSDLDLEERLRQLPESAQIRGIFFRLLEQDLAKRGLKESASWGWEKVLGEQPRSYRLYPMRPLLVAYADAGALVSPERGEGLRDIFRRNCLPYAESWFGQGLKRFLQPDLLRALRWIEKCRDHFCDYGRWRLESDAPGRATLHMVDEYLWIEWAHRGGCEGLLDACGVVGEVTAELDGPFEGRLQIRWS